MKKNQVVRPDFTYEKSVGGSILGIDEVGRGSIAGPVFAAGIVLDDKFNYPNINDSKKLSIVQRNNAFHYLKTYYKYVVQYSSVEEIDRINILQATLLAMKRVIDNTDTKYDYIFIDGNTKPKHIVNNIINIISGDQKSLSIASASIIAKVIRDQFMNTLSEKYPQYLWHKNKGYCTRQHIDAIKKHGITRHHRRTFLKNLQL